MTLRRLFTVKVAHVRLCHSRMPFVRAYLPVRGRDLDLQVTTMIVGDRTVRMARRYEVRSDRFIALEPPIDEDS